MISFSNNLGRAIVSVWLFGALLSSQPARADWEYTKWGMTPEQVASASKGAVSVVAPAARNRDEADHSEIGAQGAYASDQFQRDVEFTFDTRSGGLKCVTYNALGDDAIKLKAALISHYGAPSRESEFLGSHSSVWTKPDSIEYTLGQKPVAAVVMHCAP
jgi:hypothetical protein